MDKFPFLKITIQDLKETPIIKLARLAYFDVEKNEERVPIDTLDEIYQHADALKAMAAVWAE